MKSLNVLSDVLSEGSLGLDHQRGGSLLFLDVVDVIKVVVKSSLISSELILAVLVVLATSSTVYLQETASKSILSTNI